MKGRGAFVLSVCLFALPGAIQSVAQENPARDQQNQERDNRAAEREKRVKDKAASQEKRAATKAKRAAARAEEEEVRRAVKKTVAEAVEAAKRGTPPRDGTFKLLGASMHMDLRKVVKGAPYSATAVAEHVQTLVDGNQIVQKNEATYYRDSEGRTRIEQKLRTIGKWTAAGEPPQIITVFDPVAGHLFALDPGDKTALMDSRGPLKPFTMKKVGPLKESRGKSETSPDKAKTPEKNSGVVNPDSGTKSDQHAFSKEGSSERRKKMSLGNQMMEGLAVEGTRTITTIPAGEIGNTLPIEVVEERWYSPELQLMVMLKRRDPRSGESAWRMVNINRNEPDRSLFEVPPDYRIVEKFKPKSPTPIPKPVPMPKPESRKNSTENL